MSFHAALSPSRTKDFRQCPLLFRLRTIDRLPEPPSVEALRGTLVHSVLEHLFDMSAEDRSEQAAQDLLEPRWKAHIQKSPGDAELFATGQEFDSWFSSARTLIGNYFTMENPRFLQPDARESFINATLPSGLHIRGIIDRIDKVPQSTLSSGRHFSDEVLRGRTLHRPWFSACTHSAHLPQGRANSHLRSGPGGRGFARARTRFHVVRHRGTSRYRRVRSQDLSVMQLVQISGVLSRLRRASPTHRSGGGYQASERPSLSRSRHRSRMK